VSKVIGDFRGWDNLAAYSKAFPRFLDALSRPQQASKTGYYSMARPQLNMLGRAALTQWPNAGVR